MTNTSSRAEQFEKDGYLVVEGLLRLDEIGWYREVYDRLLSGEVDAGVRRGDLGAGADRAREHVENITQIMWPSDLVEGLGEGVAYRRAIEVAREILGDDMAFDFDMLIDKAPGTDTATPWHQDCAYWLDLPDRRAASCWIALDEATVDNGCMWFVPGSHGGPLQPHRPAGPGGALQCDTPGGGRRPSGAGLVRLARRGHTPLQPGQLHRQPTPGPHRQRPAPSHDRVRAGAGFRPRQERSGAGEPERGDAIGRVRRSVLILSSSIASTSFTGCMKASSTRTSMTAV